MPGGWPTAAGSLASSQEPPAGVNPSGRPEGLAGKRTRGKNDRRSAVSLPASQQRTLNRIDRMLRDSDPRLVALFCHLYPAHLGRGDTRDRADPGQADPDRRLVRPAYGAGAAPHSPGTPPAEGDPVLPCGARRGGLRPAHREQRPGRASLRGHRPRSGHRTHRQGPAVPAHTDADAGPVLRALTAAAAGSARPDHCRGPVPARPERGRGLSARRSRRR